MISLHCRCVSIPFELMLGKLSGSNMSTSVNKMSNILTQIVRASIYLFILNYEDCFLKRLSFKSQAKFIMFGITIIF